MAKAGLAESARHCDPPASGVVPQSEQHYGKQERRCQQNGLSFLAHLCSTALKAQQCSKHEHQYHNFQLASVGRKLRFLNLTVLRHSRFRSLNLRGLGSTSRSDSTARNSQLSLRHVFPSVLYSNVNVERKCISCDVRVVPILLRRRGQSPRVP